MYQINKGCTKFCEGCTKRSKVCSEVGIDSQSLPYEFQNEIMDHPYSDGGSENNKIRCTACNEECTKGFKVHMEVGIDLQSLMGSKMKSWTIHVQMEDLEAKGSDVPNLIKDVPNFVKDVPRVPKCVPRWGSTPNHFIMVSK